MSARHMIDFEKLEDAPQLLDLLVQMEAVLDDLDIYVYRNWLDGEVVEGPVVSRHFMSFSLLYPHHKMPDPRACFRLLKHGVLVEFSRVQQAGDPPADRGPGASINAVSGNDQAEADDDDDDDGGQHDKSGTGDATQPKKPVFWMVKITFPRRLLDQLSTADLDVYGDDVDSDDVQAAQDSGMTDEEAYTNDGAAPGDPAMGGDPAAGGMPPADPMADPMGGPTNGA